MPSHKEAFFSPYQPAQLFALVADVAQYPEFLPWCRAARILERGDGWFTAELVISFKHITEQYVSRVELSPGDAESGIHVAMVSGPFEHLHNRWHFCARDGGTEIDFEVDFKFRSRLLNGIIGPLFQKASEKMGNAFRSRADALYGAGKTHPADEGR